MSLNLDIDLSQPWCKDCKKLLNADERYYYEYRCEQCEAAWHRRVQHWRNGASDAELDYLYGGCGK